ncbi:CAP domain-containing protein [uncultured Jatrophihabitans sp.]|uniref:CAP domain-containing protein n=1 Tax=uncultured Jatrophihabitans sp. TaxID=1610747 RepID=UPI0035CBD75F
MDTTSLPSTDAVATGSARRRRPLVVVATLVAIALLAGLLNAGGAQAKSRYSRHDATVGAAWARSVGRLLNAERQAHHLRPLTMNSKLIRSGHAHNLAMARANTMSHQLPGEAYLGTRVSRAGYKWTWAGENIGYNGDISLGGVRALEHMMYNEKAPNDGHKRNILQKNFTQMGIDVYIDRTHHKVWLTCDFGRP